MSAYTSISLQSELVLSTGQPAWINSQYPQEKEYLWLPLSFLQPDGEPYEEVTDEGIVSIIRLRVIPNLKTSTLEQAEEKQKQIHIKGFEGLLGQLTVDLERILVVALHQR